MSDVGHSPEPSQPNSQRRYENDDTLSETEDFPLLGSMDAHIQLQPDPQPTSVPTVTPIAAKNEILGMACMALSALGFSVMSVLVKMAGKAFPSTQIVFSRSVFQLVCGLLGCSMVGVAPWGPSNVNRWLLVSRGAAGALGLGFYFFTIINMPLGDGTTVAAYLFLNEPYTVMDAAASTCCLVGVVLVSQPEFLLGSSHRPSDETEKYQYERYIPALSAIAAAFILSIAYCIIRVVGKRVHYLVHVTYFGLMSTILSGILLLFSKGVVSVSHWTMEQWFIMFGVGAAAFVAQCFLNAGLQLANAGPATLMRNLDIVFAFIFGQVLFHETPDAMSLAGALLIGLTTAAVAYTKWLYSQQTQNE
ncbi:hypothetical protein BSLG_004792 [Batrachochytrium salamandrivorans]|nr:hypothetical protein BSLG_004792 [Batrachochytrium salamandrivorans]